MLVLCGDARGQTVEHKAEFRRCRAASSTRRTLEPLVGWRFEILEQVLANERHFRHRSRRRVPAEQDVAAEIEVIEKLGWRYEMIADLEIVGVAQDVHERSVAHALEPGHA